MLFFSLSDIRKLKSKPASKCEFQDHYFAVFYIENKGVSILFWFRNWKLPLSSFLLPSNFFFLLWSKENNEIQQANRIKQGL